MVDWDVHHGNATQEMFYEDAGILYFSTHRHDFGAFYPGGGAGAAKMVGKGKGLGFNINVAWNGGCGGMDDADYLLAWEHVLLPAARNWPDLVIVSAGFDAARGDPLGGCDITRQDTRSYCALMDLCQGRVVVALEGGYNLSSIAASACACAAVLLGDPPSPADSNSPGPEPARLPSLHALRAVRQTLFAHSKLAQAQWVRKVPEVKVREAEEDDDDGESVQAVERLSKKMQRRLFFEMLKRKTRGRTEAAAEGGEDS